MDSDDKTYWVKLTVTCRACMRPMNWESAGGPYDPRPVCPECGSEIRLDECSHFEDFPPLTEAQVAVIIYAVSQMASSRYSKG